MVILLKENDDRYIWLNIDENGQIEDVIEFTQLDQHPEISPKEYLVIVLPGSSFLAKKVKIPKTSRPELIKAVPFALEEQLVAEVDTLYFAVGDYDENGLLSVIVVNREEFENQLNEFRRVELNPSLVIPDYLALNKKENRWSVAIHNDYAVVRYAKEMGFSIDQEQLPSILPLILKKQGRPNAIDYYFKKNEKIAFSANDIDIVEHEQDFQPSLAINELEKNPPINLLQGKYRVKLRKKKDKNRWKYVAILFALLIIILFGGKIAEYFVLKYQHGQIQNKIAAIYKAVYPGSTDVISPKTRMTDTLSQLRKAMSGNTFLDLLAPVATVINQTSDVELRAITYQNDQLTVNVSAKALSSIETFSDRLSKQGLSVKQSQLNTEKTMTTAEFEVRENANE